jgi:hypothetical protein
MNSPTGTFETMRQAEDAGDGGELPVGQRRRGPQFRQQRRECPDGDGRRGTREQTRRISPPAGTRLESFDHEHSTRRSPCHREA